MIWERSAAAPVALPGFLRPLWVLFCVCFCTVPGTGCSPKDLEESPSRQKERLAEERKEREARAAVIRDRLKPLREEMTGREDAWQKAIDARHPKWTTEERAHNFRVLLIKWEGSNMSTVKETVEGMDKHGWLIYTHDLDKADYLVIATERLAIQKVLYGEFSQLISELIRLDSVKMGHNWGFQRPK